jgi:hypothetical protein
VLRRKRRRAGRPARLFVHLLFLHPFPIR